MSAGSRPAAVNLDAAPSPARIAALDADRVLPVRFAVVGRSTYLFCPNGLGRTKLTSSFWQSVGGSATVRNWRTVNRLLEMMAE